MIGRREPYLGHSRIPTFKNMKVYTYYNASPEAPEDQAERFRIWHDGWTAQGWETRILTYRKARQSPLFAKTMARFKDCEPEIRHAALRWLALHAAGGGWFSAVTKSGVAIPLQKIPRKPLLFYFPNLMWAKKSACIEALKCLGTPAWDAFFFGNFTTAC